MKCVELAATMRRAGEPALIPRADKKFADGRGTAVARLPGNVFRCQRPHI